MVGITGTLVEWSDVSGDHDVISKVSLGGLSQRRLEARAEDSWKHNAGEIARAVDSLVRREKPSVVFLEGDERTISLLEEQASPDVRERVVRLGTGGRAKGVSKDAEAEAIDAALEQRRAHRDKELKADFEQARGTSGRAVDGLPAVVEAVRKAQVETLLLHDEPASDRTLQVGERGTGLGLTATDAREAGASEPRSERADAALVWAIVATGGAAAIVDEGLSLRDGVGAILRWDDDSTAH